MNISGPLKVYYAEQNEKIMFAGSGHYDNIFALSGTDGTFDFKLTVEKNEKPVTGSGSRAGYFQQLLLRPYKASADQVQNGPIPLDMGSLEFARRGIEGYQDIGMKFFGVPVKPENIKIATFGRPPNDLCVPIGKIIKGLPDMIKLEILSALEKMERITRGGVYPNVLDIGKVFERSKLDKSFMQQMMTSEGRWNIGKSEESFHYPFGNEKIYKLTSELKVEEMGTA